MSTPVRLLLNRGLTAARRASSVAQAASLQGRESVRRPTGPITQGCCHNPLCFELRFLGTIIRFLIGRRHGPEACNNIGQMVEEIIHILLLGIIAQA